MQLLKKYKYIITIIIVIFIAIYLVLLKTELKKSASISVSDTILEEQESQTEAPSVEKCDVDIKGAINKPGVYQVDCDENVNYVITLAGNLTKEADTSVINLAKKVSNEMVIIIYTKEQVKNSNIVDTVVKVVEGECNCPNIKNDGCINTEIKDTIGDKSEKNGKININTASVEELTSIQGVGKSKAEAIYQYRQEFGNFKSIEDIKKVSGIGEKLYEQIKDSITV